MLLPLVITLIVALPLYQVLQVVVAHPAVQYGLDFILVLTVDESCGWGWCRTLDRDGIWMHDSVRNPNSLSEQLSLKI
jgi:hypothetical protein